VFSGASQGQLYIPDWMKEYDVTAVVVNKQASLSGYSKGSVNYFQYGRTGWEDEGSAKFFTDEGLLGAIFADNLNDYTCVMQKAVAELNAVAYIYEERLKLLYDTGVCTIYYGSDNQLLFNQLAYATEPDDWQANSELILSLVQKIDNLNKDIQYQSCPVIY
ncbi:hypothetical protein KY316_01960, partial [Candidatus Woesearchaeota archaeon]|nr:hypothetical protein [Candidatus Woesearchaeota archaeon]